MALAALLFCPSEARAQQAPFGDGDRGFFFVGFTSGLGMELSGVKLFGGYKKGRGDLALELYAGALSLPPGPGAGIGLAGKYYLLDGQTWRGALGAQVGVKFAGAVVPVLQLTGTGEARWSIFSSYLTLKTGVPQVFGAALGGKMAFAERAVWLEAKTGVPLLIDGELGYSWPVGL